MWCLLLQLLLLLLPLTANATINIPGGEHAQRGGQIQISLGFLNCFASLAVFVYYYLLGLLFKKPTFMTYLVLVMSVFQFIQDLAISYHFMCPGLGIWDDDTPWNPSSHIVPGGFSCNASEWFLEDWSGLCLQACCLYMATVVLFIVVFQKTFPVFRYMVWYLVFSSSMALIFSCFDVFGSYSCSPKKIHLWDCPPNVADGSKFTPGFVGWYGSETIRTAMAFLALLLILLCVAAVRMRNGQRKDAKKDGIYQALLKKCVLYPLVQSICRLPSMYVFFHGGLQSVDELDHEEGLENENLTFHRNTRLAGFYLMCIFEPMGGFASLCVFLYVNPSAWRLTQSALTTFKSLVWPNVPIVEVDNSDNDSTIEMNEDALIARIVKRLSAFVRDSFVMRPSSSVETGLGLEIELEPSTTVVDNPLADPARVAFAKRVSIGGASVSSAAATPNDEEEEEEGPIQ